MLARARMRWLSKANQLRLRCQPFKAEQETSGLREPHVNAFSTPAGLGFSTLGESLTFFRVCLSYDRLSKDERRHTVTWIKSMKELSLFMRTP